MESKTDNDVLSQYGVSPSAGTGALRNDATFRERVVDKFKSTDFVRVINIDNQKFSWVYADPAEESVQQPDKYTRNVYHPTAKVYSLNPGESKVIPGHNAYVMVEAFFKNYVQTHNTKIASITSDPAAQEKFIKDVVIGVEDPMSFINNPTVQKDNSKEVDDDLGLVDEPAKTARRTRPATA